MSFKTVHQKHTGQFFKVTAGANAWFNELRTHLEHFLNSYYRCPSIFTPSKVKSRVKSIICQFTRLNALLRCFWLQWRLVPIYQPTGIKGLVYLSTWEQIPCSTRLCTSQCAAPRLKPELPGLKSNAQTTISMCLTQNWIMPKLCTPIYGQCVRLHV